LYEKASAHSLKRSFLANFMFDPFPRTVQLGYILPKEARLLKGSIVDLETTGLSPERDNIVSIGVLKKGKAEVHQLTCPDYELFKNFCRKKIMWAPKPRYAYNARFESDFLHSPLDNWQDLTQYGERTYDDPERGPYYTMRLDDCTFTPFREHDTFGAEIPRLWAEWLREHKPQILWQITFHNLCDLLRIRQLVKEGGESLEV